MGANYTSRPFLRLSTSEVVRRPDNLEKNSGALSESKAPPPRKQFQTLQSGEWHRARAAQTAWDSLASDAPRAARPNDAASARRSGRPHRSGRHRSDRAL